MDVHFDLERYLKNSKKVDLAGLDFAQASAHPLSDTEIRCLTYMMDVESHTVAYLRGILNTCAIEDPQTTAFLSCWAYEEFFHGCALRQFLEAAGVVIDPLRAVEVQRRASWTEWLMELGASFLCRLTPHFHAAYLTWGAIQELSTLEGYGVLARRTRNPVLAELLRRLAKDERRHFSFYFNKARLLLELRTAQRLTSFLLRAFWMPIGSGVKPDSEVDWILAHILNDEAGAAVAARVDSTIQRLPGLAWFQGLTLNRQRILGLRSGSPGAPPFLTAAPDPVE